MKEQEKRMFYIKRKKSSINSPGRLGLYAAILSLVTACFVQSSPEEIFCGKNVPPS